MDVLVSIKCYEIRFFFPAADMLPPPRPYSPQDYFTRSLGVQDPPRSPDPPALVQQDGINDAVRTGRSPGGYGRAR